MAKAKRERRTSIRTMSADASALEALAFMFSRRRTEAFAEVRAWWWNLLRPGQVRKARWIPEFSDLHDVLALLEVRNVANSFDKEVCGNIETCDGECGDFP